MRRFAVLGFACVMAALPKTALASPAECMWRSLSPATQDSMIAAAQSQSLTKDILPVAEFSEAARGCVRAGSLKADAAMALVAYVFEEHFEPAAQPHLPRIYLSLAWDGLEPAERARIRSIFYHYDGKQERPVRQVEIEEAVEPLISGLERDHGATMSSNSREFTYGYLIYRSARESLEARL